MKKLIFWCCIYALFIRGIQAEDTFQDGEFLYWSLNDFARHMKHYKKDHQDFIMFYNRVRDKLKVLNNDKRHRSFLYYFNSIALKYMPCHHPQWYEVIRPYIFEANVVLDSSYNRIRELISLFLLKYGTYCHFYEMHSDVVDQAVIVRSKDIDAQSWLRTIRGYCAESIAFIKESVQKTWYYMKSMIRI